MSKIKRLPKSKPSIEVPSIQRFNIQAYDIDNLYPQNVLNIVNASPTGSGCLERYKDFMEGDGVASSLLDNLKVNAQGETLADIHKLASNDLATFDGFALHVNYNEQGRITDLHVVPFENVRLEEPDENGVVHRLVVHPDWTGRTHYDNKQVKVSDEYIDYIDVFNPLPAVVQAQILRDGGIDAYKGQILYVSGAGHLRYPLAFFDEVLTDMSTDEGICNLMLRNARCNFLPAGMLVTFKGQGAPEEGEDSDKSKQVQTDEYSETLERIQGDTNALKILEIECESKDEVPQFVQFNGANLDSSFLNTRDAIKENIYCKFGQEGFLAIRNGKVGFSGALMAEANDDYARRMVKRQRMLSRAYVDVLSKWAEPLPDAVSMETLEVIPLTYSVKTIDNVNTESNGNNISAN